MLGAAPAIVVQAAPAGPGADVIDGARARVRALEVELVRLEDEAGAAASAHAEAQARADDIRARIVAAAVELRRTRRAHDAAVQRLSDRLVALYVDEPPTLVEVVLSSGGLSDAADTQAALEAVNQSDARLVESLERTRARLARLRADLIRERGAADAAVRDAGERLARMEGLLAGRRAVLGQATAALDGLVARERRRRETAERRRERAAAIEAAGRRVEQSVRRRARGGPDPAPPPAAPAPAVAPVPGAPGQEVLDRIAECESGGDPRAVSASGQYRGKYQFDSGTWRGVGGSGDPAAAFEREQDMRAAILYGRSGPAPWPICGYR